ncbi:MAG TPA: hypothetical protein VH482_01860 [Thermomicrobiales bacterium]|jgi:uncharacterized membrane protein YjdF
MSAGSDRSVSAAIGRPLSRLATTLETSATTRRSALALFTILAYLMIGRVIEPGFTKYWWYQVAQTTATLVLLLILDAVFAQEGGLAWQTHVIVVVMTYADVLGTVGGLYDAFEPYDKIIHFFSGAAFAASVYEVLRLLDQRGTLAMPPMKRTLVAVTISFAIAGVSWELYEYLSDVVFASGRVQSRWDTAHDLICDALGGIAAVSLLRAREAVRERVDRRVTV